MKAFSPFGLPVGISASFWFAMGLLRAFTESVQRVRRGKKIIPNKYKVTDIAAVIPAHNEKIAIRKCVAALKLILPPRQIHVVSDGSTDKTYIEARKEKCNVVQLTPGRGKAKALVYTFKYYRLFERYKFIFIVDADTRIDKNFARRALPLFNDPEIGVVFGSARITWPQHIIPRLKYYFVAYRERLNRLLQFFFGYGQTWKYTNVSYVIPGFATIYRSRTLKKLPIDTPGLLIEDFNTAFQFHKQKLGKIGYNPQCIGWDQHPETLLDYWKQVRRWNIGFFQTIRVNGFWPSFFWLALGLFSFEVFAHSLFLLVLPIVIFFGLAQVFASSSPLLQGFVNLYQSIGPYSQIRILDVLLFMFFVDYGFTIVIATMYKKPQFLFYGLFFFFMHYVTSLILVSSIIPGFFKASDGRWVSPARSREQLGVRI